MLLLALLHVGLASMPWDGWSRAVPHGPTEYYYRRHKDVLVKLPEVQCQCPPYRECIIEHKINEDMLEFQNIQGLLNDDDLEKLKKYIHSQKGESTGMPKKENIRSKRQNGEDQECCCPPRTVMMPTFITNRKFDEVAERLGEKVLSEQ